MNSTTGRFTRYIFILISCLTVVAFALPALAAYDYTVGRDKDSYPTGSTVKIQIKNTGTKELSLKSMRWMVQVKESGGWREVFTEAAKPSTAPDQLPVGELAKWTWNGKDNEGTTQPAGDYRIKVWVIMPRVAYEGEKMSNPFTLTSGGSGAPTTGWSAKKSITITSNMSQYKVGGIVNFTIKNTGDVAVDTSGFNWIVYRHASTGVQARSTHNSTPPGIPNPLPAGASKTWSWDGRQDQGGFCSPGDYELEVKLPHVAGGEIEGNCFFKIIP